jgi:hypothetical protein
MIYEPIYFDLDEIACPHVYNKFGEIVWQFLDPRLLITLDTIRVNIGKPIFINNWKQSGQFDERGFRCIQCELVKKAITENRLYVSPHMTGQGADFDVQGLIAEEVRQWLIKNHNILPYPIRLENNVSWIHLDVREIAGEKVHLFNP